MELYPIRGASTERQYMVYFPEHKILYASDTLVVNDDGSIYDPELMREVVAAVDREHLDVTTVFAMHQTPIPVFTSHRTGHEGSNRYSVKLSARGAFMKNSRTLIPMSRRARALRASAHQSTARVARR